MTKEQKKEEAISRIIAGLHCSREEAEEVYFCDVKIDHGEGVYFDLPPEKVKIAQKFAHTGTRAPTVYKFERKERKPNATKGGLVSELADFIEKSSNFDVKNLQIPQKEGKISFQIGEKWYSWTLTEHRTKPKWIEG